MALQSTLQDKRFGAKGFPAIQANGAASGYKTTYRPPLSPMTKPRPGVPMVGGLGNSSGTTMANRPFISKPMPNTIARPAMNTSAIGGAQADDTAQVTPQFRNRPGGDNMGDLNGGQPPNIARPPLGLQDTSFNLTNRWNAQGGGTPRGTWGSAGDSMQSPDWFTPEQEQALRKNGGQQQNGSRPDLSQAYANAKMTNGGDVTPYNPPSTTGQYSKNAGQQTSLGDPSNGGEWGGGTGNGQGNGQWGGWQPGAGEKWYPTAGGSDSNPDPATGSGVPRDYGIPGMGTGNGSTYNNPNPNYNPASTTGEFNSYRNTGFGAPGSYPYEYKMPAIDSRAETTMNRLNQGTNINVVDPLQNPGRFDNMYDNRNQTPWADQVGGNMDRFSSGVTVPGSNQANLTAPDRQTGLLDQFAGQVGGNNPVIGAPALQDRIAAGDKFAREGGNWNIGTTGAESGASALQMQAASSAAENGGMLSRAQMEELMAPYKTSAQAMAQEQGARGNALLAKASGGAGLDTQSIADVARQSTDSANNMIGTKFSDIMQQNLANRGNLLNTAGSLAGNVAAREAGRSSEQANLNLGGMNANINQRAQDIGAADSGRSQDVTQRQQDISAGLETRQQDIAQAQGNADRLSKDMLGFAGLDVNKYATDKGFDSDTMNRDLTAELQRRGMNLQEAQFKAGEFTNAFNRSQQVATSENQNTQQWAELAQKADQGDVNAGLQHSQLLLNQAVSSGQLSNDQANMMLNNLYNYWKDPQQFQMEYIKIREAARASANSNAVRNQPTGFGDFINTVRDTARFAGGGG